MRNVKAVLEVRTRKYAYFAGVDGDPPRGIFRYDNAHAHPGHEDAHHRHAYDCGGTWKEIEPPDWVGYDGWPHLNEVVLELEEWWTRNGTAYGLTPDWLGEASPKSAYVSPME
jgi:hypothetical protein